MGKDQLPRAWIVTFLMPIALLHVTTPSYAADSGRDANVAINNETLIATSQEKVVKLYGAAVRVA